MSLIRNIVVSGGTHGNERTGVRLVEKWMEHPECYKACCPDVDVSLVIANPEAVPPAASLIPESSTSFIAEYPLSLSVTPIKYLEKSLFSRGSRVGILAKGRLP